MSKKTHSAYVLGSFFALPGRQSWKNSQVSALTELNSESLELSNSILEGMTLSFQQVQQGFFPWSERRDFLKRLLQKIEDKKESLAQLLFEEIEKPKLLALKEVERSLVVLQATLDSMSEFESATFLKNGLEVRRIPRGPILAITPFNFPWNLVAHKVFPALALGCPVLLKPSPKANLVALALADFCHSCRLPAGMLNVIPASNEFVNQWCSDSRIAHVSFTGSADVGWNLRARYPQKSMTLELGGAAPVFISKETLMTKIARELALSSFQFAGQACISTQNIYVETPAFDEFTKEFLSQTHNFPMEYCSPLQESSELARRKQVLLKAIEQNKIRLLQEKTFPETTHAPLQVYEVLDESWKEFEEEFFMPLVFLHRSAGIDAWISTVNAYPYRLQCSIYTDNVEDIRNRSHEIQFGGIIVNGPTNLRLDEMPYGGEGLAGLGREGPKYAMQEYSSLQSFVLVETP